MQSALKVLVVMKMIGNAMLIKRKVLFMKRQDNSYYVRNSIGCRYDLNCTITLHIIVHFLSYF
ncbi:unnamed protein product [Meloidogyne enterolobii]|uniref:Uncharacterized protein n=1 Tax=Meloidogyne enterolobii TaxID=390850 RepID=A0ACB0Z7B2_MELEN